MWALEEYNLDVNGGAKGNMFHYEQREHVFQPGEVLHNFNGTDYKVMGQGLSLCLGHVKNRYDLEYGNLYRFFFQNRFSVLI